VREHEKYRFMDPVSNVAAAQAEGVVLRWAPQGVLGSADGWRRTPHQGLSDTLSHKA
jgi:hypothetical protein